MDQNQNQPVVNGLPTSPVDPTQLQTTVQGLLTQAPQDSAAALTTFTQNQQQRAARINRVADALSAQLGSKDPQVVALQSLATSLTGVATQIQKQSGRAMNWPKLRPNEWLVYGTVTDVNGNPASSLTVRVFDQNQKNADMLGGTETDENGDFFLIFHEGDFKPTGENLPALVVMVNDMRGKLLYTSTDGVHFAAGRSEYFAIRLSAKLSAPAKKAEAKKSSPQTKGGAKKFSQAKKKPHARQDKD